MVSLSRFDTTRIGVTTRQTDRIVCVLTIFPASAGVCIWVAFGTSKGAITSKI